jgi:hypothetical protein
MSDLESRVTDHLEYLLREANGKLQWPEEHIEELEDDLEKFRRQHINCDDTSE